MAFGKVIKESELESNVLKYLEEYKPDILIITGHDAYLKNNDDKTDLKNYKNSINFVKAVKEARKYEKSHEKLLIIHALDPAIIATTISLTEKNKEVDVKKLLEKTKYGKDGMGGLIVNGFMYVGYPR